MVSPDSENRDEFTPLPLYPRMRFPRMGIGRILLGIAISLACGGAIFAITLQTGYRELPRSNFYWRMRGYNLKFLRQIREEIAQYRKQQGKLPGRLEDLPSRQQRGGEFVDVWQQPYQYEVLGDEFKLLSTGRDGKRGGEGLDADLDGTEDEASLPRIMSWEQFRRDPHGRGMVQGTALAGLLTAGLAFLSIWTSTRRGSVVRTILALLGTALVAWWIGEVLVIAEIPNGH